MEMIKHFIEYDTPLAEISEKSAREKNNRNAISEVLLEGDQEKQMIQGFIYGSESYGKAEAKVDKYQKTLFEEG